MQAVSEMPATDPYVSSITWRRGPSVWISFLHDAYGLAGAWCWIRQKDDNCDSLLAGKIEQYVLGCTALCLSYAL